MRAHNSTIKLKEKICIRCGKPCFWFSKKRCKDCARIEDVMSHEEREAVDENGDLIDQLDDVFSKYVRLKNTDTNGECDCFTCPAHSRWQDMQCGHFISRKHMYLRWDERNAKTQCKNCNEHLDGNLAVYRPRLEAIHPGITDILEEESRLVHKWSRNELKAMLLDFTKRLQQLKK